jgi:FAD synthetase
VKKVSKVLVGGVFDILHYGHLFFLKKAKKLGDYLIVAIESDVHVQKLKGTNRPFHTESQRKEILESLEFVDEVIILKGEMTDEDYFELVKNVTPSILAVTKGDPMLSKKKLQAKKVGAKIVEIPSIKTHSTTEIARMLKLE